MALTFHYHPLSSFCWKVLIGLYENDTPFEPLIIDLGDPASRNPFVALWPMGKIPVLQDHGRGAVVPETTVILDYLDLYYPGPVRFTPVDGDAAWRVRLWDRFFDFYVQQPMQKIVADRIRPQGEPRDPFGVAQARADLLTAYGYLEQELKGREWISGDFGLADCAAAPGLFYADKVSPLGDQYPAISAYLARLMARPAFARALKEAEPYFKFFPG